MKLDCGCELHHVHYLVDIMSRWSIKHVMTHVILYFPKKGNYCMASSEENVNKKPLGKSFFFFSNSSRSLQLLF